ncbi:MAG: hypothetical protein GYA41_01425 [Bacteroidales bacterium]|nr:hypothetical protein [Bacteroidales bacterium]
MKKYIITSVFIFSCCISAGQELSNKLPFGFYLGIRTEYLSLGKAFDGESFFYTDEASMFVPQIEPGIAFGTQFGLTFKQGSWDMGYYFSSNRFSHSIGSSGTLHIHNIKLLGLTFYLNKPGRIRPYIVTDASMPWFRITDGATGVGSYSGQTGKSYFSGVVLGAGAGIELGIAKKISFRAEAMPEWFILSNVKGITKEYWDVKKFSCLKLAASAGLFMGLSH